MAVRIRIFFFLISVSVAGIVGAQPNMWQQPMYSQQQPQYVAAAQNARTPVFVPPARQPYFVANYSAVDPGIQTVGPTSETLPRQAAPPMAYGQNGYQPHCQNQPMAAPQPYVPNGSGQPWMGNGQVSQGYPCEDYGTANYGSSCGMNSGYCCPPPVRWGGYAGVLMLNREDENHRFYSYDSNDESYQLLDSQDTNFDWTPGVEAHIGRYDCCSCRGCEAVYWGLYPEDGYAYAYPAQVSGNLNGIFNFDQLDYNGQTANNYVDNAAVHRLRRQTELHNVEFNCLWGSSGCCGTNCCTDTCTSCCDSCCSSGCSNACGCGRCTFRGLAGVRYLRLEDNLEFASDPSDTMFTGEVDELYYNIDTDNDLFGFQLGGIGEKALSHSLYLTFGAKAGVFFNDADAYSTIGGAAGLATINNGPNAGVAWDIDAHKDDVATIAELQAGVAWAFYPTWRLRGDYRVIGISGVALPTNQIYQDLRGVQDVQLLATNGDLILHGVFVGVERTY